MKHNIFNVHFIESERRTFSKRWRASWSKMPDPLRKPAQGCPFFRRLADPVSVETLSPFTAETELHTDEREGKKRETKKGSNPRICHVLTLESCEELSIRPCWWVLPFSSKPYCLRRLAERETKLNWATHWPLASRCATTQQSSILITITRRNQWPPMCQNEIWCRRKEERGREGSLDFWRLQKGVLKTKQQRKILASRIIN